MNLQCDIGRASGYRSRSQVARVLTEDWGSRELYCPACRSDGLAPLPPNAQAADFLCPRCEEPFQLKSGRRWNESKIVDAGYDPMLRAIRTDRTPNLFILQYSSAWLVQNLLLVPRFFFSESALERRQPLGPGTRRAGWIGCNILLRQIPEDGKIRIVANGAPISKDEVRRNYQRVKKLGTVKPTVRGWALDTLKVVRQIGRREFTLADVYAFEDELQRTHPDNENIRAKLRQQLQILRDLGLVRFVYPGRYEILG